MKAIAIVLITILSVTGGYAQKRITEIPFTMDRNLILIKAKASDNKEYGFIYDTGTTGVVLSEVLVNDLGLKITGSTFMQSPNSTKPDTVSTVTIPTLKLNGFEIKNHEAVSVPPHQIFSPNASGIIGLSAFKGNLVTIDYAQSKLIIKKGKLNASDKSVVKVNLSMAPETKINVGGEEMLAVFDCGGPETISFPMEWKSKLKLKSEPVLYAKARTPGGEVEMYKAQMAGTVSFGSVELKDPGITLVTGGFHAINFGYPFLKNYRTTIDMVNQLMRFDAISLASQARAEK